MCLYKDVKYHLGLGVPVLSWYERYPSELSSTLNVQEVAILASMWIEAGQFYYPREHFSLIFCQSDQNVLFCPRYWANFASHAMLEPRIVATTVATEVKWGLLWLSTAAATSVTPTGLVIPTQPLGSDSGKQCTHFSALLKAVAAKVSG